MRFALSAFGVASAVLAATSAANAAVLSPTADTFVTRGSTTNNSANTSLAIVNRSVPATGVTDSNTTDRVSFLTFNLSAQTRPLDSAALQISVDTASGVPANFVIQVYGIPDNGANENFDPTTLTFANNGYTNGLNTSVANDGTDNNVNDSALTLLATFTGPATAGNGGTTFTISSPDLLNFLNADTNGIASLILTTPTQTSGTYSTPTFASSESASTALRPALVVTPEPTALAVLGAGACSLVARRRRA